MSKMNEARILNALNESRKNPKRFNLRESYFTEDDDFDDVVETDDYDPDYDDDDINVYQTTVVDVLSDVEGAIDDMDAIEDDLFAVEDELEDDDDEWYDDEDEWEDDEYYDDEYYDDEYYDDDDWYDDDEDDVIDIEVPDDVDDIDIPEAMLREKYKTIRGKRRKMSSAQVKNEKKKKKGWVVDSKTGRRRKQTAAEKAAHKKRGKELSRQSRGKRKKNALKAARTKRKNNGSKKNEAWSTNEKAFAMLMNGVLSNASRKSHGRLQKVKITKVNEGYVRGNRITLNCNVKNARGQRDRAKFIINGRPNGSYTINEASDFFRNSGLHVGGRYHVNRGRFVFDSMGYNLKSRGGRSVNESFKVVNN